MVAENGLMNMVYAHKPPRKGAKIMANFLLNIFSSKAESMYFIPAPRME